MSHVRKKESNYGLTLTTTGEMKHVACQTFVNHFDKHKWSVDYCQKTYSCFIYYDYENGHLNETKNEIEYEN